jgi:hypothetical protein
MLPADGELQGEDAGAASKRGTYEDDWTLPGIEIYQVRYPLYKSLLRGLNSLPDG